MELQGKTHIFTKEQKENWWGKGLWIDEPDLIEFEHEKIICKIIRINIIEPFSKNKHVFGGHLCGYCMIPKEHSQYKIDNNIFDFEYDVHGGITYSEIEENEEHWIGFDCAHYNDIIPSMKYLEETIPILIKINKKYPKSLFFQKTYKDISFLLEECKNLAEQIKKYTKNEE